MWLAPFPKCFDKNEYDVRVVLPKYMCMKRRIQVTDAVHHPFLHGSWMAPVCGVMGMVYDGILFLWIMNTISQFQTEIYEDIEKICIFLKSSPVSAPERRISAGYHPLP